MKNLKPVPENIDDRYVLTEAIERVLTGDLYFHHRFCEVLGAEGFDVSTVQQYWFHNIYEIRMKRGSFALEKNDVLAARQVRRLLKRAGFYIPPDSIHVIRNGERVRLVFVFPFGAVGVVRQKR
jgi:hypothetical protein